MAACTCNSRQLAPESSARRAVRGFAPVQLGIAIHSQPQRKPNERYRTCVKRSLPSNSVWKSPQVTNEKAFISRLARHRGTAMALEDEFGIETPDEDAEKITTVQNRHRLRQRPSEGLSWSSQVLSDPQKVFPHEPSSRCRDRPGFNISPVGNTVAEAWPISWPDSPVIPDCKVRYH